MVAREDDQKKTPFHLRVMLRKGTPSGPWHCCDMEVTLENYQGKKYL
jgi:hypothetical protein